VAQSVPLFLSSIVVSEFQVRQDYKTLPLRNMIVLPFNIDHAEYCGKLLADRMLNVTDDRVKAKDDYKLIAQCEMEGISHILTEDSKMLINGRQQTVAVQAVLLKNGFDPSWFNSGQYSLPV